MSGIAFLFPGQGAQAVGMGKALAESLPAARQLFDRAADVLGYDLARLCFEGPAEELNSTVRSQPALFVTSLAAMESLRAESPDTLEACSFAAGLSLGEYTALVFAGVMEFEDTLDVVRQRGEAMQAASDQSPSGMVSILGLDREAVEAVCDAAREQDVLRVANMLCPGNIVVSGSRAACQRAAEEAERAGAMKAIPLAVAGAFHTRLMQGAVDKLATALAGIRMRKPRIPVVSNVDARPHDDPEAIRDLLVRQVVSPVLWEDSMRYLIDQGCQEFYEIGSGRVLRGVLRRINRKLSCQNVGC